MAIHVDPRHLKKRQRVDKAFAMVCFGAVSIGVILLITLLYLIFKDGWAYLKPELLTRMDSHRPAKAGLLPAIMGSLYIVGLTAVIAIPIGVAAAVYLEEFGKRNRMTQLIQLNIANLASVPSIIYALLGLLLFIYTFNLGRSILAGALTMTLLILPMVIITSQEALRAVPKTTRESSLALGATPWQTIWKAVLPAAFPGILTGIILSVSRCLGETAPLITMGAVYVTFKPASMHDKFTALPLKIFNWTSQPQEQFHHLASAAIIVMLTVLLSLNLVAIVLRNRYQRKLGR